MPSYADLQKNSLHTFTDKDQTHTSKTFKNHIFSRRILQRFAVQVITAVVGRKTMVPAMVHQQVR